MNIPETIKFLNLVQKSVKEGSECLKGIKINLNKQNTPVANLTRGAINIFNKETEGLFNKIGLLKMVLEIIDGEK